MYDLSVPVPAACYHSETAIEDSGSIRQKTPLEVYLVMASYYKFMGTYNNQIPIIITTPKSKHFPKSKHLFWFTGFEDLDYGQ